MLTDLLQLAYLWAPSWSNVLGSQRPILTVVYEVSAAGWLGVAALALTDVLFARHTKSRWFFLHFAMNAVISVLCLPDLYFMLTDPLAALAQTTANHWPTALVFSVHVYHVIAFSNLQFVDWLHHGLMILIGAPLLITGECGPLMNYNNFWMCGVPGGLDYLMLFLVKHGVMAPISEKKWNSIVNVWIRAPFLVSVSTLGYLQTFLQPNLPTYITFIRLFLMLLASWNALFFMERVVGNYHVCHYKLKKVKKEEPQLEYATAEHIQPSFLGMRTALSQQDLTAIADQKLD